MFNKKIGINLFFLKEKKNNFSVYRKMIKTTMQRKLEALTAVMMVERSGRGWAGVVVVWLHSNATMVMGRKMKMGYGLTQLWDWNKNVIDFGGRYWY